MIDFFPHKNIRPIQKEFMNDVGNALLDRRNLIVHAPTGLGKTAAALAPTIKFAIENNKVVFFLTSRHTQHKIAVETMKLIKKEKNVEFNVVDFIGKKSMCLVPGVESLSQGEFMEYCRTVTRKDYTCKYYVNTRTTTGKTTFKAEAAVDNAKNLDIDELIKFSKKQNFCPYELSLILSEKAKVVVCDYYYIFNKDIRSMILGKLNKELSDVIIVVDEAHNLPFRIRDLMTSKTSKNIILRAVKEADKYEFNDLSAKLNEIGELLEKLSENLKINDEILLDKNVFIESINSIVNGLDFFLNELESASDLVREEQKMSFIGSFHMFLSNWLGDDDGFTRILSKKEGLTEPAINLSYRCLDPGIVSKEIIRDSYSTILMSGTLVPTEMYKDLLDVYSPVIRVYESPFPKKNKLNLIVPETTTKFTYRNEAQFSKIAEICAVITNNVPGNSAIFFPSYALRDKVNMYFRTDSIKSQITEESGMSKEDKQEVLQKLFAYKDSGIVLLGASSGSFGEGVDFPGDLLKCVIVVGLPLNSPDLETKETINYFDRKFGKGWNYGYIFPAFNKVLQNAGRCIRSETDKGVIVFLDERYSWPQYFSCFPDDTQIKITKNYENEILSFFNEGIQHKLVEEEDI